MREQVITQAQRAPGRLRDAVVVSVALVAVSVGLNVLPFYDGLAYVPVNLALGAGVLVVARRVLGLSDAEIGLDATWLSRGLLWGWAAIGIVGVAYLAALTDNESLELLTDRRYEDVSAIVLAAHALIRVPLGTVVLTELALRGVVLATWTRVTGGRLAIFLTSLVQAGFVAVPVLDALETNVVGSPGSSRILHAVALCAGWGLVSWGLCYLRRGSRSLLAPAMAAWAIGGWGVFAAGIALRVS